jgi:hypothetical protein
MSEQNDKFKESNGKSLYLTATILLVIWILIISLGIFTVINSFLTLNSPFVWAISYENPFLYFSAILMFFSSRNIAISISELIKRKQWVKPSRFIRSLLIQLGIASIASILTIIFFRALNFSEFFSLFISFSFLFSIVFFSFCLYYFRYDIPYR